MGEGRGGQGERGEGVTTAPYRELTAYLLGHPEECSLSEAAREALLETARRVAAEQRFFHWELEFPEVFRRGGFDAIVGNPPWDTVKPNSREFWSNYDPFFRDLGKQAALRRMAELRQDPEADRAWRGYSLSIEQTSRWLREAGLYTHQGRGDLNTYKLFLERAYHLLRPGGGLGFLLPSGIYTDLGTKELRQLLFGSCQVRYLLAFANERFIFPAVHHAFRFVLLVFHRGGHTEALRVLFRLNVRNAVAPAELAGLLANVEPETLRLSVQDIRRFSPDTLSLMEFKNQREVEIAARIYDNHPLLGEEVPGAWNVRFTREFDMTNDSRLFRDKGPGWPLYEGRMVGHFDHRAAYWVSGRGRASVWQYSVTADRFLPDYPWRPQWWLPEEVGIQRAHELYGGVLWRLGICNVTAPTNERTIVATILPPQSGAGHALNVCQVLDEDRLCTVLFVQGMINSLVFDFVMRFKIALNASPFLMRQAPLPRPRHGKYHFDALVPRAARLTCTTPEFADLWDEVARRYPQAMPASWRPELAATDPRERAQLRAEIDALVADLYGLSEEDFAYILTTFPLLDRDQPALPGEPKSFITRDQALLALFRLRGKRPPEDIVAFFAAAGADIAAVTGEVRALEERVRRAWELGAVAYVPSGRGGAMIGMSEEEVEAVEGDYSE